MAQGQKPGVQVARQLFLYGNGDGRPVTNTEKLAELSGLHTQTISKHMKGWIKERESIVSNSETSALGISLSPEILNQNKEDLACIRNLVEAKKYELDRLEEITVKLEAWMDKFEGGDHDFALRILEAWQRNCGLRSSLESQLLALHKHWASFSGVVGMMDVSLTAAKELSKGRAKLTLKKESVEFVPKNVSPAASGVFARTVVPTTKEV